MTTDPPVELAQPRDAGAIAAMSRDLIETGLPWTWRERRVLRAIRELDTNVAVLRSEEGLAGFGIMEYRDEHAYLALLAVHPGHRRRGVGDALLRWLEASARAAGAGRIRLETRRDNAAARVFYNEQGFHEVGIARDRYGDGVDGLVLEKWLRPREGSA